MQKKYKFCKKSNNGGIPKALKTQLLKKSQH